jgi:hypothetical protein
MTNAEAGYELVECMTDDLYTELGIANWLERRAESYDGDAKRALQLSAECIRDGSWQNRPSHFAPASDE